MVISFTCPHCRNGVESDPQAAGARVACPHCGKTIEVPRVRLPAGTMVGGFRIQRLIGAGGMGEVYLARQLSLDRDVALKIFAPEAMGDRDRVRSFLNEVRLLARLEHPNIVTAHEAGEDGGVLYMAMAFVNGDPLDALIEKGGPVPEKRALQIARKIAGALAYAWNEHRLLHRDIKPSNILLDAHGEPKLADLGLSRTADLRGREAPEEEILGTPNYMSPEQIAGTPLDCRSDMYALGATLYHLLTARLPFEAGSVMETLQKQVSESLPDPRVFAPATSEPCVRFLEILLAKDREQRHPTWEALIADLDRVKAHKMPMRHLADHGASVLLRAKDEASLAEIRRVRLSSADLHHLHHAATSTVAGRKRKTSFAGTAVAALLVAALAALAVWGIVRQQRRSGTSPSLPDASNSVPVSPENTAGDGRAERMAQLEQEWQAILTALETAQEDDGAFLRRVEAFQQRAVGSPFADPAARMLLTLRQRRHAARQKAANHLRAAAEKRAAEAGFEEAARFAESYDGPFARELSDLRRALAEELRKRGAEQEVARAAAARAAYERLLGEISEALLRQNFGAAQTALKRAMTDAPDDARPAIERIRALVERAARAPEVIIESFRPDIGRTLAIAFVNGVESWELLGAVGGRLQLRRPAGLGFVERVATLDDLSPVEKYKRVGPEGSPEAELSRGLIAYGSGRGDVARRHFEALGEPLGPALIAQMAQIAARGAETAARRALEPIVRLARQALDDRPLGEIAAAVRKTAYNPQEVAAIRAAVANWRQQHGATPFARDAEPLLAALENVFTLPREVERAAVDAAIEALRRSNPSLEQVLHTATLTPTGVRLSLVGNPGLTNIAALASLPIIRLSLPGGSVSDLAPLKGLPIESLDLSGCPVSDLSPLAGAPLREARFERCPIENLGPLKGAPLIELDLRGTRVRSLAPLAGAPLKSLRLDGAPVESLDPLAGAPLEELSIRDSNKITSIAALQGAPLKKLTLAGLGISDLRPLRGAPLTELNINSTAVSDLTPLQGAPLENLRISHTRVRDLSALADAPLRRLEAAGLAELSNLEPLRKAPLEELWISGSKVKDLAPIARAPLVQLDLRETPVGSLEPLRGSKVEILFLDGCENLRELDPLLEMPRLTELTVPRRPRPPPELMNHPKLERVGYSPDNLLPLREFRRGGRH